MTAPGPNRARAPRPQPAPTCRTTVATVVLPIPRTVVGRGPTLEVSLVGYLSRVAAALGVPAESTASEVSDTATAYLGLTQRWCERPGRDLMLVWDERLGWYIAVESAYPGEKADVLAYLAGDVVPAIATVARFVTDAAAGRRGTITAPAAAAAEREVLSRRMSAQISARER